MTPAAARTWKKIGVFYLLTLAFSVPFNALMIRAGDIRAGAMLYMAGLMWGPAAAAVLTKVLFRESVRDLGWGWGKTRYPLLAWGLPILYGLPVYVFAWVTGLGAFGGELLAEGAAGRFGLSGLPPALFLALYVFLNGTLGLVDSTSRALGEEIGWRGFLVPELAGVTGMRGVGLVSGILWAAWHFPLMLTVDYGVDTPRWYGFLCFTGMIMGCSFILVWLRLRSGSLWTAAILHGSHNRLIFGIFAPLTADTGITDYVVNEYGVGLAVATCLAAALLWRIRPVRGTGELR